MIELLKKTKKNITFNFGSILIFELGYRLLTMGLFFMLLIRGVDFSLQKAGYSYLTGKNILPFLCRPYTLPVIAGLLLLQTLFISIEITSLLTAYQASMNHIKTNPLKMLYGGVLKIGVVFQKGWRRLPFMILGISFLMTFPILYLITSRLKPVSFVFTEMSKNWIFLAAAAAVLLLLFLYMLPNLLVTECCFLEKLTRKEGRRKSRRLLKGKLKKIIFLLIIINLMLFISLYLLYLLFAMGSAVMVVLFADKSLSFAIMTRTCDTIELAVLLVGAAASIVINHAALTAVYHKYTNASDAIENMELFLPDKKIVNRKTIAISSAIAIMIYGFAIFNTVRSGTLLARKAIFDTQITAHRGSSISAPENTLEAIEKAIEELADYAEIDLQLTQDEEVVLLHDNSLKRTTGSNIYIWNLTFDELQKLDASYNFGKGYENIKVPKFEEVLALCKGKINLNVELKSNKANTSLVEKALELIDQYGMEAQCVITCTNLNMLVETKAMNPRIKTGFILPAAYGNYYESDAVDFISIRSNFVTEAVMNNAHSYGKEVHAWTVNTKMEMERLKLLGVDNIITDRPVFAREVLFRESASANLLTYIKMIFN